MEGTMFFDQNALGADVSDARRGNREAFGRLIDDNKISMYRIAKGILKSNFDIEDAISNTILKAYTNILKLRRNEAFKPWLFKILINECYTLIKKGKREMPLDVFERMENAYDDQYENFELMRAVEMLEESQRIVTILFYYEDMSLKEISKALGLPEGTIKSKLSRAKEKLRKHLNFSS